VVETLAELDKALADLRFDAAANAIYHFVWDQFCDWYLELIKGQIDDETKAVAGWVLDQILVMLHPFMPFITEELWAKLGARENELIVAQWPAPGVAVDAGAKAEVEWVIRFVSSIRAARNEVNVPAGEKVTIGIQDAAPHIGGWVANNNDALRRLARLGIITFDPLPVEGSVVISHPDMTLLMPLEGIIDIAAEKARLEKALDTSRKEAKSLEGRLSNPAFVEKAKPEAVEKARADHALHAAEAERLAAALARLG
jgi:valyl-tRNA synthetase